MHAERIPKAALVPGPVRAAGGSAHRATGGCQARRTQGGGRRRTDRGDGFPPADVAPTLDGRPCPGSARWPPRSGPWLARALRSLQEGAPNIIPPAVRLKDVVSHNGGTLLRDDSGVSADPAISAQGVDSRCLDRDRVHGQLTLVQHRPLGGGTWVGAMQNCVVVCLDRAAHCQYARYWPFMFDCGESWLPHDGARTSSAFRYPDVRRLWNGPRSTWSASTPID